MNLIEECIKNNSNLNPFKVMGFSYDIDDMNFQQDIINYIEHSSNKFTLNGYNYQTHNVYTKESNSIQMILKLHNKKNNIDLATKFNNLNVHHTNKCVWKSVISETESDENSRYFISSTYSNSRGKAIIKYLNDEIEPYILKDDIIYSQVNCYAYDIKFFKKNCTEMRDESHYMLKFNEENINLSNNTILSAKPFHQECDIYDTLNYIKGDILEIHKIRNSILNETQEYYMFIIDTEFGKTPIICSQKNISNYNLEDYKIGDNIEAICTITGDLVIKQDIAKIKRDKEHYMYLLKKAFEQKNMDFLDGILDTNAMYISEQHTFSGKEKIIDKLQYIINTDYRNKQLIVEYAKVIESSIDNFKLSDEILCLTYYHGNHNMTIEFIINISLNENNVIDRICLSNNNQIKFKIYDKYGKTFLDDNERSIIHEITKILEEKNFSVVDISTVLMLAGRQLEILKSLLLFLKRGSLSNENNASNLFDFELERKREYENNHPIFKKLQKRNVNLNEYHPIREMLDGLLTWRIKYNKKSFNTLVVSSSNSTIGEMSVIRKNSDSYYFFELFLQYGDLNELYKDNRNSLKELEIKDSIYNEEYHYNFKKICEQLEADLKKYERILIYSYLNDSDAFLLPYYFINRFYDNIKNKKIDIIYIDEHSNKLLNEFNKEEVAVLLKSIKTLSDSEICEYKNKWNDIVKHKCDIRNVKNGKIEYRNITDFYDEILDYVKELKKEYGDKLNRTHLIQKCLCEQLISKGEIEIYNHIIDNMIKDNLLISKDYYVDGILPKDLIDICN